MIEDNDAPPVAEEEESDYRRYVRNYALNAKMGVLAQYLPKSIPPVNLFVVYQTSIFMKSELFRHQTRETTIIS